MVSGNSISARINRLFNPASGNCFDVAIDHGFFNEGSFLAGIEDMKSAIATVVDAMPDAVQLTVGTASILQHMPIRPKPALVLRTDVANVYGRELPSHIFSRLINDPVETGVRLDAACVVANVFRIPDQPDIYDQCLQNVMQLRAACDRYAMPLMVEPLVFQPNEKAGGYMVDGDIEKIAPLVRQCVELGADIIKADPTDDPEEYVDVVALAGDIPILVRGGGRVSDDELLRRTEKLMDAGARGIVYGRNVIQHPEPNRIVRALMEIVHRGKQASPSKVAETVG